MRRLVVPLLLLAACTNGSTTDAVVLDEFSITLPDIDASTRELTVRNEGDFTHTLVVSDEQGSVVFATGAIEAGDYITTSAIAGYGQRQDDDLLHSYTLGKAIENVDWETVEETIEFNGAIYKVYLIAVVYTSG